MTKEHRGAWPLASRSTTMAALVVIGASACGAAEDSSEDETRRLEAAAGSGRHAVIADVDLGGGVLVANRPGGYYMGRLFVGWHFDRHGAWYFSEENHTNYAWAMAWGHSNACLWVGPSRGKIGFTAGTWATPVDTGYPQRCTEAQKKWLAADDGKNIGSHFNCTPPSSSAHGTEKALLVDAPFSWNIDWRGGTMGYDGGPARDLASTVPAGTHVWYRYTTRDKKHLVAFVPGLGWGFFPVGVLNRAHTGSWSFPTDPGTLHPCS